MLNIERLIDNSRHKFLITQSGKCVKILGLYGRTSIKRQFFPIKQDPLTFLKCIICVQCEGNLLNPSGGEFCGEMSKQEKNWP